VGERVGDSLSQDHLRKSGKVVTTGPEHDELRPEFSDDCGHGLGEHVRQRSAKLTSLVIVDRRVIREALELEMHLAQRPLRVAQQVEGAGDREVRSIS
jgi:hypothetical protein